MTTFVLANLGVKALYLTYLWLLSAVAASWLSDRKGYGERPGLITGLLLSAVGAIIWVAWPAKADSRWKVQGAIPKRGQQKTVAEARAERDVPGAS
jgi:fucose permease